MPVISKDLKIELLRVLDKKRAVAYQDLMPKSVEFVKNSGDGVLNRYPENKSSKGLQMKETTRAHTWDNERSKGKWDFKADLHPL